MATYEVLQIREIAYIDHHDPLYVYVNVKDVVITEDNIVEISRFVLGVVKAYIILSHGLQGTPTLAWGKAWGSVERQPPEFGPVFSPAEALLNLKGKFNYWLQFNLRSHLDTGAPEKLPEIYLMVNLAQNP